MDDPSAEYDRDDKRKDQDEHQSTGQWTFSIAPWTELRELRPTPDAPSMPARWHERPVWVIAPHIVNDWAKQAATWQVTLLTRRDHGTADAPKVDVFLQDVSLAESFTEAGLVSQTVPPNAVVVIDNSRGIQVGDHNKQLNIHEFDVRNVSLILDKAFERRLNASVDAGVRMPSLPTASHSTATPDGHTKIVVKNSLGVQIGDYNRQRNVFQHTITGPAVTPDQVCSPTKFDKIVDKIRAGAISSARSKLIDCLKESFQREPDPLYDSIPGNHNVSSPNLPKTVQDVNGGIYGKHNKLNHQETTKIRDIDLGPLIRSVRRQDEALRQALTAPTPPDVTDRPVGDPDPTSLTMDDPMPPRKSPVELNRMPTVDDPTWDVGRDSFGSFGVF